jgi:hypothetical protein
MGIDRGGLLARITTVAIAIGLASGCASQSPPLRVENCGIVAVSSPTKYVCNGKVYTSFELTNLRQDIATKTGR